MAANAHSEGAILRRGDGSHPRSHPRAPWGRRLFHWVPTGLVLLLVGSSFAVLQWDLGNRWFGIERSDPDTNPAAVAPPSGLVLPSPAPAPVVGIPVQAAPVDAAAVRRALAPALEDPDLGDHVVAVVGSPASGTSVFSSGSGPVTPASSLKLLTTTAALSALGPATTFTTSVVQGDSARDLVLVGGGDPYLASKPDGTHTAYPHRADVVTLARRTAAALKESGVAGSVRVRFDDSLFTGPAINPHWPDDYVADSVVSPISALWVDHGALGDGFHRAEDPGLRAAQVFVAALRKAGVGVTGSPSRGTAAPGGARLASVESAPLDAIVQEVVDVSDNEAAEVLLRHLGLAVEGTGSFTAGVEALASTLSGLGVETSGLRLYDGSGLSRDDRLSARTLLGVLQLLTDDDHPELRAVLEGLPVAAFSGSLEDRFAEGAVAGRGWVRAKTGTLTGISALAGLAQDADGTLLPFVIVADRIDPLDTLDARAALDRAAAALAGCHCGR